MASDRGGFVTNRTMMPPAMCLPVTCTQPIASVMVVIAFDYRRFGFGPVTRYCRRSANLPVAFRFARMQVIRSWFATASGFIGYRESRLRPLDSLWCGYVRSNVRRCIRIGVVPLLLALGACAWFGGLLSPLPRFDLQAHRGGRGLAPENTLAAFRNSIAIGVHTLETDLAMTSDGVLVLAHDPYLNPALVRGNYGQWLTQKGPAIHSLSLAQLRQYDIGRLNPNNAYAKQWPQQSAADGERFATLDELFVLAKQSGRTLRFNIETKIAPNDEAGSTPTPQRFAQALVQAIERAGMQRMVTIQSFDWRTLIAAKKLAPQIRTVCLTAQTPNFNTLSLDPQQASPWHAGLPLSENGGTLPSLVRAAGCDTWSMFWRNLTPQDFAQAKSYGLMVVPWTVNETEDMRSLIALGVDGLITDYPNRLREMMHQAGIALP